MKLPFSRRHRARRFATLIATAVLAPCIACSNPNDSDGDDPAAGGTLTDAALHTLATAASGWTYYRLSPDTLSSSLASGHAERRLRIRFNARAATQLDANGRVRANAMFPDSSLIVKELYGASGQITTLAVMFRRPGDANLAANWLWGYFDGSGNVRIPLSTRGNSCTGCHSAGIDHSRANELQ